jgi:hypothetical protein
MRNKLSCCSAPGVRDCNTVLAKLVFLFSFDEHVHLPQCVASTPLFNSNVLRVPLPRSMNDIIKGVQVCSTKLDTLIANPFSQHLPCPLKALNAGFI